MRFQCTGTLDRVRWIACAVALVVPALACASPAATPAPTTKAAPTATAAPAATAATAAPAAVSTAAKGEKEAWEVLGKRHVTDKLDHDTIPVTVKEGTFTKLQVRVNGPAVQFRSMKVNFANGETQDVELKDVIKSGRASRVIDLTGAARVIKSVDFVYDAQTVGQKGSTVRLFGKH